MDQDRIPKVLDDRLLPCSVYPCSLVKRHMHTDNEPLFCLVRIHIDFIVPPLKGSLSVWRPTRKQWHTPQGNYGYRALSCLQIWTPRPGKRKPGRTKTTWRRIELEELAPMNSILGPGTSSTKDRDSWKEFTKTLYRRGLRRLIKCYRNRSPISVLMKE